MSDPQYTDPNRNPNLDPNRRDPLSKGPAGREKSVDRTWAWVAGIAVVVLVAFVLIGGWGTTDTAGVVDPPAATVTGSPAPSPTAPLPPATTGQGNAMQPATPPAAQPMPPAAQPDVPAPATQPAQQ